MDPVSCVALATGAFKALKGAVAAGRDFQDMTSLEDYSVIMALLESH